MTTADSGVPTMIWAPKGVTNIVTVACVEDPEGEYVMPLFQTPVDGSSLFLPNKPATRKEASERLVAVVQAAQALEAFARYLGEKFLEMPADDTDDEFLPPTAFPSEKPN